MTLKNFKGTHDIYGSSYASRQSILKIIEKTFKINGFEGLDTPAIEYFDLLHAKYGEDNEKLFFNLAYKDSKTAALRYDLTVPLSRFILQNKSNLNFPYRRYQIQKVWRADAPQFGRYREFYQCDADILSLNPIQTSDLAEIFFISFSVLNQLKKFYFDFSFFKNFKIYFNHRAFLEWVYHLFSKNDNLASFFQLLDKKSKMKSSVFEEEFFKQFPEISYHCFFQTLNKLQKTISKIWNENHFLSDNAVYSELKNFLLDIKDISFLKDISLEKYSDSLFEIFLDLRNFKKDLAIYNFYFDDKKDLDDFKNTFQFSLFLARGMDYYHSWVYEGIIEEIDFSQKDSKKNLPSISGGGIYSFKNMIDSKSPIEGIGVSFGLDRIFSMFRFYIEKNYNKHLNVFLQEKNPAFLVMIIRFEDEDLEKTYELLKNLHKKKIQARIFHKKEVKIKKQMQYADKQSIPIVVFLGKEEILDNQIKIKILSNKIRENKEQTFPYPKAEEKIQKILKDLNYL